MKRLILLLTFAIAAAAQIVPGQYIVELSNDSLARHQARRGARLYRTEQADGEFNAHRAMLERQQNSIRQRIEQSGGQVLDSFRLVRNALVVKMSAEQAAAIQNTNGVKRVRPVRMYYPLLDHSLPLQKVNEAWTQIGGMDHAGLGIKIGIIDTGIDSSHPAFQDSSLTIPDGFPIVNNDSDKKYTNNKVIVARAYDDPTSLFPQANPAMDNDGHGTGVAMIVAGVTNSGPYGPITGVAPKAYLGNYKVFPDGGSGAPDSLIIRALEDAVQDGMDVMNLSLGGFPATRPSDDELVQAVEDAIAAGKVVVIAVGNQGPVPNTIGSPGTAPSAISVGSTLNDRIFASQVQMDGKDPVAAIAGDTTSSTPITGPLADVAGLDSNGMACDSLPPKSLAGSIALILRGVCTFETKLLNAAAAGAIAAVVYTDEARPDAISMSTGTAGLPSVMVSNKDGVALRAALAAAGSLNVTIDFSQKATLVDPNHLSSFTSRGPNSDNGIKPDMLAVGSSIYTASPSDSYVVESGTSFSSPTVAGAVALVMGARPGLSGPQYRSLIVNNTSAFTDDPPLSLLATGTGLLNVSNALQSTVTCVPGSLSFGSGDTTFAKWQTITFTNVGSVADTFSVQVVPQVGSVAPVLAYSMFQLDPGKSADVKVQWAAENVTAGAYEGYLQVQGTKSPVASRIPYWYGIPTQQPAYLQILDSPTSGRRNGMGYIYIRFLDAAGLPVTQGVDNSVAASSDLKILSVDSNDSDIPGSFVITVRFSSLRGAQSMHIQMGDIGQDLTIPVR